MDSARLIERMTSAYPSCQSFEDSGTIREVEIEAGETNVTLTSFRIQFVRGQAYRMEIDADRTYGVGPYSLVYHWDGRGWSSYDSLNLYYGWQPVRTNVSKDSIIGSGVALSFGLFPDMPRLLHLEEGDFSGFRRYDSAQLATDRLGGRPVYRLTLRWEFWGDDDTDEYWIAPDTFTVLQRREHSIKNRGDRIDTLTRMSTHSPRLDTLPPDARIEFSPPKSRANFCSSECAGRLSVTIRSSQRRIAERFRSADSVDTLL
ncbi:MAG: hypothetical protein DME22_17260 [Verrucomicrobia bacterium]|nr:MAG: hypothetical protein DME22_17260 [Verrucomicrobiota bacterium]PYJ97895.1 MAG: hypothetical protein DME23_13445 [Verrucomicrobiota bacterium]